MNMMREEKDEDNEASMFAMSIAYSVVRSYVVKALIELGVFEIIKKAGHQAQLSSAQIVGHLPTTNPDAVEVLDRMLRLMASLSILTFSTWSRPDGGSERLYGLGPVCKYLTKNEDGVSFAPLSLVCHDKVCTDVWNNFKYLVLEDGQPFKKTHGMPIFEYTGKDPRFSEDFYTAMHNHSIILGKRILETYNGFEGLSSLVDVGGGKGDIINMIITKYPTIKGINFDLPHVVKDAPSYPGVEHVEGDMYASIPQADAIFMKWTLHQASDDEQCVRLLKNCHASLPEHGKVIVCEYILPDEPETTQSAKLAYTFDMVMLSLPGGKERTKHEYAILGKQAGFSNFHLVCNVCDSWIMEFIKMN